MVQTKKPSIRKGMYIFWNNKSHNKEARGKPITNKNFGIQVALIILMPKETDLNNNLIVLVKQSPEWKKVEKKLKIKKERNLPQFMYIIKTMNYLWLLTYPPVIPMACHSM